jgi:hypothetical protein
MLGFPGRRGRRARDTAGVSEGGVPNAGLCNRCRHQQVVATTRGSRFSLCLRSKAEPERFPRYPRLPVTRCAGFEPAQREDGVE